MLICQLIMSLWVVTLKMWPNENLLPNQKVVQTKMPKNKCGSAYNISSSNMQPIDQAPKLWEPPFHVSWYSVNVTLKCVRSRQESKSLWLLTPAWPFIPVQDPDEPTDRLSWAVGLLDRRWENIVGTCEVNYIFGSLGTVQLCSSCWAADGAPCMTLASRIFYEPMFGSWHDKNYRLWPLKQDWCFDYLQTIKPVIHRMSSIIFSTNVSIFKFD
jgi:hypothetical protein